MMSGFHKDYKALYFGWMYKPVMVSSSTESLVRLVSTLTTTICYDGYNEHIKDEMHGIRILDTIDKGEVLFINYFREHELAFLNEHTNGEACKFARDITTT